MIAMGFWLACTGAHNAVPSASTAENVEITLETVDLEVEFGVEWKDWFYHLKQIDISEGQTLSLPEQSGWAVFTDEGVQQTGFYPQQSPEVLCKKGCRMLSTSLNQSRGDAELQEQSEQDLSDTAPQQSSGLMVLDTWATPLSGVPTTDKSLRLRAVELAPNGNVGQHKHNGRPSFAYIVGGDLIEHRGDGDAQYHTGDRVAERNGLVHWWENGEKTATIIVFDIISSE